MYLDGRNNVYKDISSREQTGPGGIPLKPYWNTFNFHISGASNRTIGFLPVITTSPSTIPAPLTELWDRYDFKPNFVVKNMCWMSAKLSSFRKMFPPTATLYCLVMLDFLDYRDKHAREKAIKNTAGVSSHASCHNPSRSRCRGP